MQAKTKRIAFPLSLALFSLLAVLLLPQTRGRMSPWKDAALLALPLGTDLKAVHALLDEEGMRGAVSAHSQTVSIAGFGRIDSFALEDLEDRLLPEDPRRDRWMEALKGYFRAQGEEREYSLVYLPRSGFGSAAPARLLSEIEGSFMVEGHAGWGFLPPLLVFSCALWILFLRPSFFPKALLIAVPWALASLDGGTGQALASMAGAMTSLLYALSLRTWPFQLQGGGLRGRLAAIVSEAGILSASLAVLSFLVAYALSPSWRALAAIPATFALVALSEGRIAWKRPTHPPFVPLRIKTRHSLGPGRLAAPWSAQAVAMGLAAVLVFGISGGGRGMTEKDGALSIPHPDRYTSSQAGVALLPGYGEYTVHAERQASFMRTRLGGGSQDYREAVQASDGTIRGMRPSSEGHGDPRPSVDGIVGLIKAEGRAHIVSGPWRPEAGKAPREAAGAVFFILVALPALLWRPSQKREQAGCEASIKAEAERKSA